MTLHTPHFIPPTVDKLPLLLLRRPRTEVHIAVVTILT